MKQKKLLIGAIAMVLTLNTAIAVYAADTKEDKISGQYQNKISLDSDHSLTFDETDPPEGVHFIEEVSMDDSATPNSK